MIGMQRENEADRHVALPRWAPAQLDRPFVLVDRSRTLCSWFEAKAVWLTCCWCVREHITA